MPPLRVLPVELYEPVCNLLHRRLHGYWSPSITPVLPATPSSFRSRDLSSPLDHSGEASRSKWSTALGREHEGRLRLLLTMQPPEGAQLVTDDRMRAGSALLGPADVQGGRSEVNLLPA